MMAPANRVEQIKQQLDAALQSLDEPAPEGAAEMHTPAMRAVPAPNLISTATRLVVGSLLLTGDAFAQRALLWEQLAAQVEAAVPSTAADAPDPQAMPERADPEAPAPAAPDDSQLVLAAIGWMAAIPSQLSPDADLPHVLETAWLQITASLATLARGSLFTVSGGRLGPQTVLEDPDLRRWIVLGQIEAQRSRALAGVALVSIMQEVVAYLASEPAVQQLVQEQGTTLAGDVLDEVREYTVSGDTLVDGLVHRFFGRRRRLSGPAEAPQPIVVPALEEG